MCGIVAILNIERQTSELRQKALRMSQKIRHRGPDGSGIYSGGTAVGASGLTAEALTVSGVGGSGVGGGVGCDRGVDGRI